MRLSGRIRACILGIWGRTGGDVSLSMGRGEGKMYVNRVDISFLGIAMTVGQQTIGKEGQ